MYTSETKIRVRYGETDQMGYVYYGNYAEYFEVGRVEAMRELGMSYKSLEDRGIMLPVLDMQVKFIKPSFYDDELTIKTHIIELPSTRIKFEYEVLNEKKELVNKASTTLVFFDKEKGKPISAPKDFIDKMKIYFEN